MSIIAGGYAKKGELSGKHFDPVLEGLSVPGAVGFMDAPVGRGLLYACDTRGLHSNLVRNEDDSLVMAFAGHLYGFDGLAADLRARGHQFEEDASGATVMLHGYEQCGDDFLRRVNGTFAFAVYDSRSDELVVGNDAFGLYPMFVRDSPESFLFCSKCEPLARHPGVDRSLDHVAIADYFAFGLPFGNRTLFSSISNLSPGTVARVGREKSLTHRYDDLAVAVDRESSIEDLAAKMAAAVRKAVRVRLRDPERVTGTLSAGADTRLVMGSMSEEQRRSVEFITRGDAALAEDEDRDVAVAKQLAQKYDLNLQVIRPGTRGQRRPDPLKRLLRGLHGGEFLGGMCLQTRPPEKFAQLFGRIERVKIRTKRLLTFTSEFLEKAPDPYARIEQEIGEARAENKELQFCIHQMTRGFFTRLWGGARGGWLSPCLFPIGGDSPFWDQRFLKQLLTVPSQYLADYRLYSLIYRSHFPDLAKIPTNSLLARMQYGSVPIMQQGTEPKRPAMASIPEYSQALAAYLKDPLTWKKNFYHPWAIRLFAKRSENHPIVRSFIDFEGWYRKHGVREGELTA